MKFTFFDNGVDTMCHDDIDSFLCHLFALTTPYNFDKSNGTMSLLLGLILFKKFLHNFFKMVNRQQKCLK